MKLGGKLKGNISITKFSSSSEYEVGFEGSDYAVWFYLEEKDLVNLKDKIEEALNENKN